MTTKNANTAPDQAVAAKKRGRKPVGDKPMTSAERMKRLRDKMRAEGGKDFVMTLSPHHMVWIRHFAEQQGVSEAVALRLVLDNALDYFASYSMCLAGMKVTGASREECDQFSKRFWPLNPPAMPDALVRAVEAAQ